MCRKVMTLDLGSIVYLGFRFGVDLARMNGFYALHSIRTNTWMGAVMSQRSFKTRSDLLWSRGKQERYGE